MITPKTILRDSALALPGVVVVAAWVDGWLGALGALVAGLVALGNLALLSWLVRRVVRVMAAGGGAGPAVVLAVKSVVVVALFLGLVVVFPPRSVALGLGAAILGLSVRAIRETLRIPHPEVTDPLEDT